MIECLMENELTELLLLSKKEVRALTKHYFIKKDPSACHLLIDTIKARYAIQPAQAYTLVMLIRLIFLYGQPISIKTIQKKLKLKHKKIVALRLLSNLHFAKKLGLIERHVPKSLHIYSFTYSLAS